MIRFLKNRLHYLSALFSCLYWGFPGRSMTVIGITGTSGKTTTTHLIYEIIKRWGKKVSMVSTIAAYINGESYDTGFHVTTPSPWALQGFMNKAYKGGSKYFILETTSHALDQFRIFGSSIDIAVVTNITHEHLDYHKNLKEYARAKAKILSGSRFAVLNADDQNYYLLSKKSPGKIISVAINNKADFTPKNVSLNPKVPGEFNLYNVLMAYAVGKILEIPERTILSAINSFQGIPGRMEEVNFGQNFRIFIDFAHKPDALKSVLETLKPKTKKRLIVVFGCAGKRDSLKRPIMGEIAGRLADFTVLTAEDPRTEDVRDINSQIAVGCLKSGAVELYKRNKNQRLKLGKHYFYRIADRQEAINFSIRQIAQKGDLVLITGKGHEQSMCYENVEYPWDEKKAVKKAVLGL